MRLLIHAILEPGDHGSSQLVSTLMRANLAWQRPPQIANK